MDEYLNMFPQDLLTSNKKVKPIDVRKIEHEDFIDYEIEFVELSEESKEDGSADVAASPAPGGLRKPKKGLGPYMKEQEKEEEEEEEELFF